MLSIPDGEVSDKARRQLAVAGLAPQRPRGMARHPGPRLLRRQAKLNAGHVHRQMQAGEGAGAGVEIGRHRHRHLVLAQQLDRRFTGFIKEVECAGEQGCHGAAFAHRRHALFRQILDMVGGKPMIAAHQLRAAQRRELLNVAFYRNAQRLRRLKDALSLLRAEADVFAEDVNAFKQSLLPQRR